MLEWFFLFDSFSVMLYCRPFAYIFVMDIRVVVVLFDIYCGKPIIIINFLFNTKFCHNAMLIWLHKFGHCFVFFIRVCYSWTRAKVSSLVVGCVLDTLLLVGHSFLALMVTIIRWAAAVKSGLDFIKVCGPPTGKWCSTLMVILAVWTFYASISGHIARDYVFVCVILCVHFPWYCFHSGTTPVHVEWSW